ncbi:lisH domain-containing protein C1711.05-like [Ctenocephalides felis]|uniref:lisH domain-containing protein C1711.05-like n=1 Tax=Ctenocephalides felis TaxID=7515 RepID=UPI000E6E25C4|nr:lisH domain-containing protein C1711.05-like [Ctenocephalides felis]
MALRTELLLHVNARSCNVRSFANRSPSDTETSGISSRHSTTSSSENTSFSLEKSSPGSMGYKTEDYATGCSTSPASTTYVAEKADFTHLRNLDENSDSSSDENSDGEDLSSDDSKSSSSSSNSSSSSDDSENGESDAENNDASHYQHGDKIANANQNIFGDKVSELKNDNLIHVISDDSRFTDSNDSNIQMVETFKQMLMILHRLNLLMITVVTKINCF